MTKRIGEIDYEVTNIELEHGVTAGIRLRSLGNTTIPPYYEHRARLKAGIELAKWLAMDPLERAFVVAIMHTEQAVEGHQTEAEIREAKKRKPKDL